MTQNNSVNYIALFYDNYISVKICDEKNLQFWNEGL